MLNVSSDFNSAFKNSKREVVAKVKIKNTEYLPNKIKDFKYSTGAFGGDKFQIGSVESAVVKITFTEVIENLKELDELTVSVGISIPGKQIEYVSLGKFYINGRVDPDRNENKTVVEATDGFVFMEGSYESKLNYPAKLSAVALEIANMSGTVIDQVSFNHLSNYTINKPEGYSYRQAIGLIAQYEAGFACFDRDGRLAIRTLFDPAYRIDPNEYYLKGLTKSELLYQPKGIICKVTKRVGNSSETTVLTAGSANGAQVEVDNNSMNQYLLEQIWEKIKNVNFYPISLKWRGNPALEIGDWVTMTDRLGKQFKSPILNYSITYDGGIVSTISASTKAQSPNVAVFKGPLQQKLDEIDYRLDAAGKNNVYDSVEEPQNPKEGDIWFRPNGPDTELCIYGRNESGELDWLVKTTTATDVELLEAIAAAKKAGEDAIKVGQTASSKADKAQTDANAAVEQANEAIRKANNLEVDTTNSISNLTQTVTTIQSTVANKAEQSQVTQLAGQITSVVGDIDSILNNAQDIIPYFERGAIDGATGVEVNSLWVRSPFVRIKPGTTYLFFNGTAGTTVTNTCYWYWYDKDYKFISRTISSNPNTAQAPATASFLRVCFNDQTDPETIQRNVIAGTQPIKITMINKTQITQLQNAINLRVQSGKVISQINISPETILISGKKVQITGDTFIENGVIKEASIANAAITSAKIADLAVGTAQIKDAAITNAKIGTVSADKITTGTLNAALVNVINVNAANLSGGYISANRIAARSITGDHLTIDAVQVGFNAMGNTMRINSTSLSFYSGSNLQARLTESGMEFWYGSRKIGQMGENQKSNYPNIRGITVDLERTGDYISWAYRQNTTDTYYTTLLTLDPRGSFTGNSGIVAGTNLYMSNYSIQRVNTLELRNTLNLSANGISITGLGGSLKLGTISANGYQYAYLSHGGGQAGIFFGSSYLYLNHAGYFYNWDSYRRLQWFRGQTVSIPTKILTNGVVDEWVTITF
ncbi:hypothetical protein [Enterococcus sp. AZ109]|uniref:hypothetical protein n=1 Tax=Enterococcus sp. AZ109 TaxID=2774634 RepID=UPI003F1F787B